MIDSEGVSSALIVREFLIDNLGSVRDNTDEDSNHSKRTNSILASEAIV